MCTYSAPVRSSRVPCVKVSGRGLNCRLNRRLTGTLSRGKGVNIVTNSFGRTKRQVHITKFRGCVRGRPKVAVRVIQGKCDGVQISRGSISRVLIGCPSLGKVVTADTIATLKLSRTARKQRVSVISMSTRRSTLGTIRSKHVITLNTRSNCRVKCRAVQCVIGSLRKRKAKRSRVLSSRILARRGVSACVGSSKRSRP